MVIFLAMPLFFSFARHTVKKIKHTFFYKSNLKKNNKTKTGKKVRTNYKHFDARKFKNRKLK